MNHSATYSPEDDKLRLYFTYRIPREEWDALRAAGWVWCMKQSQNGGCDMAAVWTPEREDQALELAGDIGDEDQPRAERAADRAERFESYGDKREGEAVGLADRYDAGPAIHANQSEARAERAAARHDRIADRAVNQWSKAEYWTRRTAGVIEHALYLDRADVRHRRIKGLEADLRRSQPDGRWFQHLTLRIAYENQMLAAQGGTGAQVEMVAGGFIGKHQIQKLSKDRAGRISKLFFRGDKGHLIPFEAEHVKPGSYRAPTAEEAAAFAAAKKEGKAGADKKALLLNPTKEAAQALVDRWNAATEVRRSAAKARGTYCEANYGTAKIHEMSAEQWSTCMKRSDSYVCREYDANGHELSRWDEVRGTPVCRLRVYRHGFAAAGTVVVVLTDKPQVLLPIQVEVADACV